jgi:hypothetical protein
MARTLSGDRLAPSLPERRPARSRAAQGSHNSAGAHVVLRRLTLVRQLMDRQRQGVITIDHGLLPTSIGFPGVFVAIVMGVTVPEVLLVT